MNPPSFRLDGRVALVTGASSGLGQHFAGTLARAGARVAICARRSDRLTALAQMLEQAGAQVLAVPVDVTDPASVRAAFDRVEQGLGTVEVVVNNAGITATGSLLETDSQAWDEVLDTNLGGSYIVAREGARRLVRAERSGSIINVASILGLRVAGGTSAYATSKAGLIQLSKAMALELARHEIRVNALAPGYVETDLNRDFLASEAGQRLISRIPQRRVATPEDLDGALLLLASDAGRYITGTVIPVDGGHLISSL
ncbi:SDR family NAD(P)-dependent oxidoreductase [Stutzerimonas tarimensis]|uniref:SDR family NAD(P)-dependent oxidoreductase n=1 Tax=Stutzerimonas tarimensis TaxID=1507735 RepID=A0ABV7TAV6_9GAMM